MNAQTTQSCETSEKWQHFCYANSQNITKTKTKSFGEIAHLLTAVQLVIKLLSSGVKYVDRIYIYKGMKRK